MAKRTLLTRRNFLKGVGAVVAVWYQSLGLALDYGLLRGAIDGLGRSSYRHCPLGYGLGYYGNRGFCN